MSAGPTLLQRTWDLLDSKTEIIMMPRVGDENELSLQNRAEARHQARGIAEVLALFMVPHFTTADEIVREAVRRYKAKQAGDTEYETAGLGSRAWEPPPGDTKYKPVEQTATPAPRKRLGARKPAEKQLTEAEKASIKQGLTFGITASQLADTFKVSVQTIESLRA